MKIHIRSLTVGVDDKDIYSLRTNEKIGKFLEIAKSKLMQKKINVRTERINLPPFNNYEVNSFPKINQVVNSIAQICKDLGIRWFCLPFSTFGKGDLRHLNDSMIEFVKRYPSAFINIIVANQKKINLKGILQASNFITSVSELSSTGYDNFRVGVSCNIIPNTPFFPFTYQKGETNFSVALELIGVFTEIIKSSNSEDLDEISEKIKKIIIPSLIEIENICNQIEKNTAVKFSGIDISLAPLPAENNSVSELIELLGVESFGNHGTLFLTSFLTNLLKSLIIESKITSVGFNGVMFSHLEDSGMGKRNNTRSFSIDSLLSYSSVCGCGIDMVPIPGNSYEEEIASLILDVAGLSNTWNKPLGVRLLPIPMKNKNEFTNFNHDFLYNTRIKELGSRCIKKENFNKKNIKY